MKIALRIASLTGLISALLEVYLKFQANQILLGALWCIVACAWVYVTWVSWKKVR